MKKLTTTLSSLLGITTLFLGFTNAAVLQDAIQWGYDEGLTSYNTTATFRSNDSLRRDEAAKFFVEFAGLNGKTNSNYGRDCLFYDINKSRSDLKGYVTDACSYGFLKGKNGYVNPDQKLTNAQAVTVVVRMIDGIQSEANVTHRADNYYKRALELWLDLSKFWNKDTVATRGNVMLLLYDAYNGGTNTTGTNGNGSVEDVLQQLVNILEE